MIVLSLIIIIVSCEVLNTDRKAYTLNCCKLCELLQTFLYLIHTKHVLIQWNILIKTHRFCIF